MQRSRHFLKLLAFPKTLSRVTAFRPLLTPSHPIFLFSTEKMEFKTETKKLLDIVAKSLYTDKHVFIRELLSNSSDALEKRRLYQLTGDMADTKDELSIKITFNHEKRQIIFQDSGIGMNREELIENLGTIAHSGSKAFMQTIDKEKNPDTNIIGQFGVGFYSSFIVGDYVEVLSKKSKDDKTYAWCSDGSGTFEISESPEPLPESGTKIVISLRPDCNEFSSADEVMKTIQKFSNFINFPIYLEDVKVNMTTAIWARPRFEITSEEYQKFFEFVSNSKMDYKYKLHYTTDAPLSIKALLYIPGSHMEKYGMTMEQSEVSLYSKKILIKPNCKEMLPNWLRFVKGVVDCDDIPLNISRENYQDSNLMLKLKVVLTKRILKVLTEESEKNEKDYIRWYEEFQYFLKEGAASDPEYADSLLSLMRFQSSFTNDHISLDNYIAKLKPEADKIFFVLASNKENARSSPYMEPFRGTDIPVLYIYMHVDEMIFKNINMYKGKYKFINIETDIEDVNKEIAKVQKKDTKSPTSKRIPEPEIIPFSLWLKSELQPVVSKVIISKRLKDSPCVVTSQMSTGMRQMMTMINREDSMMSNLSDMTLEINDTHDLIVNLNEIRKINPNLSSKVAKQLLDNSLLMSGMLTDPKSHTNRVNVLLMDLMRNEKAKMETLEDKNEEPNVVVEENVIEPEVEESNKQN